MCVHGPSHVYAVVKIGWPHLANLSTVREHGLSMLTYGSQAGSIFCENSMFLDHS